MPPNRVNDLPHDRGIRGHAYSTAMTNLKPRELVRAQVALESFGLTPDGTSVVYVLRRVVRDEYESHLFSRPYRGGRARQLTRGRVRDGAAGDLARRPERRVRAIAGR